jgi:hypothetical protein
MMSIKKGLLAVGFTVALAYAVSLNWPISVSAQDETPKPQILFINVNIFDGQNDDLAEDMSVLVQGNLN